MLEEDRDTWCEHSSCFSQSSVMPLFVLVLSSCLLLFGAIVIPVNANRLI